MSQIIKQSDNTYYLEPTLEIAMKHQNELVLSRPRKGLCAVSQQLVIHLHQQSILSIPKEKLLIILDAFSSTKFNTNNLLIFRIIKHEAIYLLTGNGELYEIECHTYYQTPRVVFLMLDYEELLPLLIEMHSQENTTKMLEVPVLNKNGNLLMKVQYTYSSKLNMKKLAEHFMKHYPEGCLISHVDQNMNTQIKYQYY